MYLRIDSSLTPNFIKPVLFFRVSNFLVQIVGPTKLERFTSWRRRLSSVLSLSISSEAWSAGHPWASQRALPERWIRPTQSRKSTISSSQKRSTAKPPVRQTGRATRSRETLLLFGHADQSASLPPRTRIATLRHLVQTSRLLLQRHAHSQKRLVWNRPDQFAALHVQNTLTFRESCRTATPNGREGH